MNRSIVNDEVKTLQNLKFQNLHRIFPYNNILHRQPGLVT